MQPPERIREIPYNYTSFSDREIVIRLMGEDAWRLIDDLRRQRRTGRSARMLYEVLGDIWAIRRNPFLQDDLLESSRRRSLLLEALHHRLRLIQERAEGNDKTHQLIGAAETMVAEFETWLRDTAALRKRVSARLRGKGKHDNVDFSGLARVAHTTDATDWRVAHPLVVLKPDSEAEVADMVQACIDLGLTVIARGGGTGYTGGAIPLYEDCAVINLEKLDALQPLETIELPGNDRQCNTICVEAGVITRRVADQAGAAGLAFAVDPTSQDASTIGGNIAMNAGGKKAVIWGTTIDNLLRWKMVTADANWLTVERIDHNQGKIHEQDIVRFDIRRIHRVSGKQLGQTERLEMPGSAFRKAGLGKDVTDKALGGLPGIQKEGCDGIVTSAEFILHPMQRHTHTVCLEFYRQQAGEDVAAIVDIKRLVDDDPAVQLAGLEHLDSRYILAVKYSSKANRPEQPRMLLLADIAADDETALAACCDAVVTLARARGAEGFIATTREARDRFWLDRKRTAAISAHTNAFKINEDVVIPLEHLAEYSRGIEIINIEQSIDNKLRFADALHDELQTRLDSHLSKHGDSDPGADKLRYAIDLVDERRRRWRTIRENFETPVRELALLGIDADGSVIDLLLSHTIEVRIRAELRAPLEEIFAGLEHEALRAEFDRIHATTRYSRLFVALHMHAGDGNVHTNIPVHSDDYAMLHAAEAIVDRVMTLAGALDGVVSGEHGIGLTKLHYLDADKLEAFRVYKQRVDPTGVFNRGKLLAGNGLENAYTPSLALVQAEALILEHSDLGEINDMVKNCLRCGKCKPECMTHIPRANLLYSPRDKILATGMIIEAFLYEEQTRRGISQRHFTELDDVADHCTTCHKCKSPCPVDIDFGDVSIAMRKILTDQGKKPFNPGSRLAMWYLNLSDPLLVNLARRWVVDGGMRATRGLRRVMRLLPSWSTRNRQPANTTGGTSGRSQVVNFVRNPIRAAVPKQSLRQMLKAEDSRYVPIVRDPAKSGGKRDSVFYFPGCGSERLYSQIGLATVGMLYQSGANCVLPPGYLCCGFPQTAAGRAQQGKDITTRNRVLFHRVANTLNYLDIRTVVISCGTCLDQLEQYEFEQIFPGSRIVDIHEYLMEHGFRVDGESEYNYTYHDPCHTPMKQYAPLDVASKLMQAPVEMSDRCCGEAGTLAAARPDIAHQLFYRKLDSMKQAAERAGADKPVKCLTACPACQQGLSRYQPKTGIETDYIVVELARRTYGEQWQQHFIEQINDGGIERVLL